MPDTETCTPAELTVPDMVGPRYIRRALQEQVGYRVHRSAVLAAIKRSGFPAPVFAADRRETLGQSERLYYRLDVDYWIEREVASGRFAPRPAADIPRRWGQTPKEELE